MNTLSRTWLPICWLILLSPAACADTLWIENAENGYANVIDGTSASYPLIQSSVVGEGDFAFHLAHPNGASGTDEYFVLDKTLTIQPSTRLYFLSRLGLATSTQVARVQISTNGGSSWPTNIYHQPGSGGNGEGSFSLKEISLSAYASQNVRFRFYYDTSGSHYPQTTPGVGWYVDNIQIGDEYSKLPWSIGDPSPHEQQYLEYINRARANAMTEANRLRNETDPQIVSAYNSFNVSGQNIVNQFQWYVDNGHMDLVAQPLSFQSELLQAARLHSQDQFQNQFQGHNSSSNPPAPFQSGYTLGQRLDAVGYDWQSIGENVYANAKSVAHGHAGFDVDWGNTSNTSSPYYNPAFAGQGMQNPAGHRRTIHNDDYKEIGIGIVNGTNGSVGPQIVTQDFGYSGAIRYITGVVYDDLNNNTFYDIGEGRSGVRIDVNGSPYYALSSTSGGYSVPVSADGAYNVLFTGGGFASFSTTATVASGKNVKVDYLVLDAAFLAGDYNGDGAVNAADYTLYRNRKSGIGGTTLPFGDDTPGVALDDFTRWKAHFGETSGAGSSLANELSQAPEPASACLVGLSVLIGLAWATRARLP